MRTSSRVVALAFAAAVAGMSSGAVAQGARPSVTIGLPGIPPVFVTALPYVAQDQKLFDKHGVSVTLRPFDTGTAAARAVVAGDIELSISPTPLIVNMISNANVDLLAIYGFEKPTWRIGSMDPAKSKCEDLKGQPVAVDTPGGARSIALNQMLRACNLTANDTQQVAMSSNGPAAMIAGQIQFAVLHLDEVPIIERQSGKKVTIILDINQQTPVNHYLFLVTTRKRVAEQRDALVRVLAALIEAGDYLRDPKNIDRVAQAAAPTGRSLEDAKRAVEEYVKIDFWPKDSAGLTQKNIDAVIAVQKRVGGIRPEVTPASYERIVDASLWDEAMKLLRSR